MPTDRQSYIPKVRHALAEMTRPLRRKTRTDVSVASRICQFKLSDLVRVDFVFPYGRVAASRDGIVPEPYDRDAPFAADAKEILRMKASVVDLFNSSRK